MSEKIIKVDFADMMSKTINIKKKEPVNTISTFDGTIYEEFDDGSWAWTEDYNGKETAFHEYSDGTKTMDYINNNKKRVIDTLDKDGNILNMCY